MTQSREITWDASLGRKRPIAKSLTKTIKMHFGGTCPRIITDPDRIYIAATERHWIEVVLDVGKVTVVTRNVDATVYKVADDLAARIARRHTGKYTAPPEPADVRRARLARVDSYLDNSDTFYDDPDFD